MSKGESEGGSSKSAGRAAAAEIIGRFPPPSDSDDLQGFREETIAMAEVYQAAGLNLASRLALIGRKELFRAWGKYSSLKAYATQELRLTAKEFNDLMTSHTFLEKFEQKTLDKPTFPVGAPSPTTWIPTAGVDRSTLHSEPAQFDHPGGVTSARQGPSGSRDFPTARRAPGH